MPVTALRERIVIAEDAVGTPHDDVRGTRVDRHGTPGAHVDLDGTDCRHWLDRPFAISLGHGAASTDQDPASVQRYGVILAATIRARHRQYQPFSSECCQAPHGVP